LLLAGKPMDRPSSSKLLLENDLSEMRSLAMRFARDVRKSIDGWRNFILSAQSRGKKIVLWSALSKAVSFLTTLKTAESIQYAVDINPQRQGRYLAPGGQKIVPPGFLRDFKSDYVILMNPIYVPEVQADLDKMSLSAKVLAVGKDLPGTTVAI
jgi:hypothetical protein